MNVTERGVHSGFPCHDTLCGEHIRMENTLASKGNKNASVWVVVATISQYMININVPEQSVPAILLHPSLQSVHDDDEHSKQFPGPPYPSQPENQYNNISHHATTNTTTYHIYTKTFIHMSTSMHRILTITS